VRAVRVCNPISGESPYKSTYKATCLVARGEADWVDSWTIRYTEAYRRMLASRMEEQSRQKAPAATAFEIPWHPRPCGARGMSGAPQFRTLQLDL
jgi:hypothetical protein